MKNLVLAILLVPGFLLISCPVQAHCDTKDGPVVADAIRAIEQNNVNYVLKWVQAASESEIRNAFVLTMKVRTLSPEAKELADNYFYETLVRVHRNGEGIAYTGIRPAGTPVDEKILAADKAIAWGNLTPLDDLVPAKDKPELKRRFDRVMSLKKFDVDNVEAGREYIEAYVQFFHFAEGKGSHEEVMGTHVAEQDVKAATGSYTPWILAGIFFFISIMLGIFYFKKRKFASGAGSS